MNSIAKFKTRPRVGVDEVLKEVWRIKDNLSASYGHDVSRLFAEARRHQAEEEERSRAKCKGKLSPSGS